MGGLPRTGVIYGMHATTWDSLWEASNEVARFMGCMQRSGVVRVMLPTKMGSWWDASRSSRDELRPTSG